MPRAESRTWVWWKASGESFKVELPVVAQVLDSRGDLVVTTSVDHLDRPSIQVFRLETVTIGDLPEAAPR